MYLGLLFTGITSLGILGFTIFDLQQKQEFLLHFLPQSMLGGVTQITDLLSTLFIQFDWGCLLLVCGPILMIAAALLQPTRRGNRRPPPAMLPYVVCRTCSMASPIGKSFCANCGARLQVLPVDYVAPSLPIDQRRSTAQPSALRNMPPHP
jgi:hypothetical protein